MIPDILTDRPFSGGDGIKYNNITSIEMITDVSTEPVSLVEAKEHLRVSHTEENTNITRLISVAREQVEDKINLALAEKTIKVGIRNEKGNIKLPYWTPNAVLDELTDKDGDLIDEDGYDFFNGVLETVYGETVFAEYTTGFETCPAKYKQMILERLSYLFQNRGDQSKPNGGAWLI